VLGTGGVGSAALFHLARRGVKAAGIDRFPPGHDRGSSHGRTRVIRLAYFEHPDYVPLLRRAYRLWEELERHSGLALYRETGLLQFGPPSGELVRGVLASAKEHNLEVEEFDHKEARKRYPAFRVPATDAFVFEKHAGYLAVEACVKAHAELAVEAGATLLSAAVTSWEPVADGVEVVTDQGRFRARRLIITPGAWAPTLLGDLSLPLQVLRKPLFWFPNSDPTLTVEAGCPVYLAETPKGYFYGFPADEHGLKVAMHSGGDVVTDPLQVDRSYYAYDLDPVVDFARSYMGVGATAPIEHAVCMYTMSKDAHFVLDRHPASEKVVYVAGLSGHGFKFTSVLGEILTELSLDGAARLPVSFLSAGRFKA
jgi:sarcosine oxidase